MKERIQTYVEGLDRQLGGGIPKGHVVMISGMPGTMKSSITYNILHNNALKNKKKGLYLSLEQSRESLIEHMENLGFHTNVVKESVNIIDMGFLRLNAGLEDGGRDWMAVFKMYVEKLKESSEYEILVIDSLPVLELFDYTENRREKLFHLFGWLRSLGITTLVIGESTTALNVVSDEDFLTDGGIKLKLEREERAVNLYLSIVKMRGTKHSRAYFPLIYEDDRFEIITE